MAAGFQLGNQLTFQISQRHQAHSGDEIVTNNHRHTKGFRVASSSLVEKATRRREGETANFRVSRFEHHRQQNGRSSAQTVARNHQIVPRILKEGFLQDAALIELP